MNVVNFLKSNSLDQLKTQYSIKVKEYPEHGLIVLNYKTHSPQKDPITKECRGLILSADYKVVSRAFDRFFNFNEMGKEWCNQGECFAMEKIDGSLIKFYKFDGKWHISTRGTAFGECFIGKTTNTYKQATYEALGVISTAVDIDERIDDKFQQFCKDCNMNDRYTYILELTGKNNRIVTEYNPDKYELWLLGIRKNDLVGEYIDTNTLKIHKNILRPKVYTFKNIFECIERAEKLRNLQEGFVVYPSGQTPGQPVCKVKSPRYVRIHSAGTCRVLSNRDTYKLIARDEWTEFIAYFPKHAGKVNEILDFIRKYFFTVQTEFEKLQKSMKSANDFKVFDGKPWKSFAISAIQTNQTNLHDIFMSSDDEKKKLKYLLNVIEIK